MKIDSITINLFVSNVKHSTVFYADMLDLELVMQVPESGDPVWTYLLKGNHGVMLQGMDSLPEDVRKLLPHTIGATSIIYVKAHDIDECFEKARLRGCIARGMETTFYGHREFTISDPDGYLVTIAEEIESP